MDSSHNHDRTSRVGLVYDDRMCQHSTPNGKCHYENPKRIKAIWSKLEAAGIPQRCEVFSAKEAEDRCIALVHTKKHIDLIRNVSSRAYDKKRKKIAAGFDSIYLNKGSSQAAYLAAGSVIEVSERIAKGELNSAVAIVRPPGHHAEPDEAMGFCLFNNVAIAASFLLNERPELGVQKILIVDWDVHHGNGTQKMFWKDPRALFFSVHRFDFGSFYPSGDDGSHSMVGEGLGAGYNVNVPWEHGGVGDADYFAVWDHILIPIAKAFNPDMILISGGFDAAVDDPLGGCSITPYGYSIMMKKLMEFAHGRIMMALEGGYNLDSLANSVLACVETLLEDKPIVGSSEAYPFESTWRVIQAVRQELSTFWPILNDELPKDLLLTTNKTPPVEVLISSSDSDAKDDERANENLESSKALPVENSVDVVDSLSMLKIDEHHGKGSKEEFESCLQTEVPKILKSKKIKFPDRENGIKKPNAQLAKTQPKTVVASDVQQKSAESSVKLNAIVEEVDLSTRVFEGQKESHTHPEEVDHSTTTFDGQGNTTISKDDVVLELKQKIDDSRNKGSDEIAKSTSGPEDTQITKPVGRKRKSTTTSPDAEKSTTEILENHDVLTRNLFERLSELDNKFSQEIDRGNIYEKAVEEYMQFEEKLTKQVTNLQKDIGDLETNLLKYKQSEEELKKETGDLKSVTVFQINEINLLKSEKASLVSLVEGILVLEKETSELKSNLKSKLDQMKTMKSNLESMLDQVKTEKSKLELGFSQVKIDLSNLTIERDQVKDQLEQSYKDTEIILKRRILEIQRYAIKLEQLCYSHGIKNLPPRPSGKWLDE